MKIREDIGIINVSIKFYPNTYLEGLRNTKISPIIVSYFIRWSSPEKLRAYH
jgi:hypothetical protein